MRRKTEVKIGAQVKLHDPLLTTPIAGTITFVNDDHVTITTNDGATIYWRQPKRVMRWEARDSRTIEVVNQEVQQP